MYESAVLKYTKPYATGTVWYTTGASTPKSAVTMYLTSSISLYSPPQETSLGQTCSPFSYFSSTTGV